MSSATPAVAGRRPDADRAETGASDVRVHHFGAADTCMRLHAHGINVVLGRSGAGRTALCRLIAGLDPAGGARVRFGAEDVTDVDTCRRNVGLVFGEFVNYPSLTVAENIAAPLRAAGLGAGERARRVADMAARVGLHALLDRLPEELSGGQQQRVALARALVKAPAVLLLDEPLVNLDYKLREALQEELRVLFAQTGTVVVYTTSDPREAMNLADHLVLLDAGVPIQQGAPLALQRAPASSTAADLLCDPGINLARARVDGDRILLAPVRAAASGDPEPVDDLSDRSRAHSRGHSPDRSRNSARISLRCPSRLRHAGSFLLGIRPDHLLLAEAGDPDALTATVLLGETTGSDSYLHLRLDPEARRDARHAPSTTPAQGALEWVAHIDGLHAPTPGSQLQLVIHDEDLLAFRLAAPHSRIVGDGDVDGNAGNTPDGSRR